MAKEKKTRNELTEFIRNIRKNYALSGMSFSDALDMILLFLEKDQQLAQMRESGFDKKGYCEDSLIKESEYRRMCNQNLKYKKQIADLQDIIKSLSID